METPDVPRRTRHRRGWFAATVTCVLAVSLLALAVPRMATAWLAVPAQSTLEAVQNGLAPSSTQIDVALAAMRGAARWHSPPRLRTDMALLLAFRASMAERAETDRRADMEGAETLLREAVPDAPANPYVWFRLALAREALRGPSREVADALVASTTLAPNLERLMLPRLAAWMGNWQFLKPGELPMVRRQVVTVWAAARDVDVVLAVAEANQAHLFMLWGLEEDAPRRAAYLAALEAFRAKPGNAPVRAP